MSFVQINSLRKEFGDLVAVDDVSFDIEEGSFTSIVGPSGSGKSTILRMIGGFESPTSGEVIIDNEDVTGYAPFERDVNMVFQDLALFPHLTVGENIKYGLQYSDERLTEQEQDRRVEEMLEMVDLSGYGDRDPAQLSGGEQQRVAVARAVVNEPKLLLFDEPLASLDRKLRQHMQVELQRIQSETGITFLYVTHDQEVALSVSDQLLLLNDGAIEQMGTPETLYDDPQTAFTADFIGDINAMQGTVAEASDGQLRVEFRDFYAMLPQAAAQDDFEIGDQVAVCVRPSDMVLTQSQPGDGQISIPGETTGRTYRGDGFQYRVRTADNDLSVSGVEERIDVDQDVYVIWKPEDTLIYSQADELATGAEAHA